MSLCAKQSDVKVVFYSKQPLLVLEYKEACFATNNLNLSLSSVDVSLLQKFEDMFPKDVLSRLPPIKSKEHQIDFIP